MFESGGCSAVGAKTKVGYSWHQTFAWYSSTTRGLGDPRVQKVQRNWTTRPSCVLPRHCALRLLPVRLHQATSGWCGQPRTTSTISHCDTHRNATSRVLSHFRKIFWKTKTLYFCRGWLLWTFNELKSKNALFSLFYFELHELLDYPKYFWNSK